MNSEIEIVDFSEKYISDVLNVLYESNILHIKSDPDYFAKTGKERSLPRSEEHTSELQSHA